MPPHRRTAFFKKSLRYHTAPKFLEKFQKSVLTPHISYTITIKNHYKVVDRIQMLL